jgi:outer membrane protein assembly factor BamB
MALRTILVALAGLALALAAVADAATHPSRVSWTTDGFDLQRTGYNPHENTVRASNASHLHKLWKKNLGGVMIAQPVEAVGVKIHGRPTKVVYEGTESGDFYALRADNGNIIWHRSLGSVHKDCPFFQKHTFGVGGAGAISARAGVVYVAGGNGNVYALDLATGAERRGWPVRGVFNPHHLQVYGGLTLFKHRLYLTDAGLCDIPPYHGGVTEIDVAKHRVAHRFYPAGPPKDGVSGGGIWGPGGVSIDPSSGDVYTATGNALKSPENYLYSEAMVKLTPSLRVLSYERPPLSGEDVDFGATPVLFKPAGCPSKLAAVENKSGALVTYRISDIAGGPLQRLQMADISRGGFVGEPAWDPVDNTLYVANSSDSSNGPYKHGMVALKAGHNCMLSLRWQQTVGPPIEIVSPPTVAAGVVYFGEGPGNRELAFNAVSGKLLWQSSGIGNRVNGASSIVNGKLFVPTWDHHLYAFGL